jgi:two-component system, chemotaxis family, chemotaxis protein CheY
MRILVVDDSRMMRQMVIRSIQQAGYGNHTYEEAASGAEALKLIRANPPELVLSDWNMPEMSGIDLLTELQANGPQVKFGFVTSEATPQQRQKAREAGALFLITKPFTVQSIQKVLDQFIMIE